MESNPEGESIGDNSTNSVINMTAQFKGGALGLQCDTKRIFGGATTDADAARKASKLNFVKPIDTSQSIEDGLKYSYYQLKYLQSCTSVAMLFAAMLNIIPSKTVIGYLIIVMYVMVWIGSALFASTVRNIREFMRQKKNPDGKGSKVKEASQQEKLMCDKIKSIIAKQCLFSAIYLLFSSSAYVRMEPIDKVMHMFNIANIILVLGAIGFDFAASYCL